jgi:GrpB-like predicted nucleotidyltransferase (UPF0157 family)
MSRGAIPIGRYQNPGAVCRPYDPRAPEAAAEVVRMVAAGGVGLCVEHVGSSAVPDCDGKGILDLLVLYPPGGLEAAKSALAGLGFQKQTGRDPFPEERPMRVGSFSFAGGIFQIHAHVVARDSAEAGELLRFRDALRRDPNLRRAYAARKRAILAAGVADSVEYSVVKGEFVRNFLDGDFELRSE